LPGLVAGMVTVALTGRLAIALYRDVLASLVATLAVALSPFALLFSATGFIDPVMVALGLAGCVAAADDRPGWAGALAGLAFAAKQTGLVWLPLVGGVAFLSAVRSGKRPRRWARALTRGAAGFVLVMVLVLAWDRVRVARGAESFWQVGLAGYGGLRISWASELVPRLQAWGSWLLDSLGSPVLAGLLLVGVSTLVLRAVRHRDWTALFDLIFVVFSVAYLLIHWMWAFQVWDRYLLPLVPVVAMLGGRLVSEAIAWLRDRVSRLPVRGVQWAALGGVVLCLACPAARAVTGRLPVGAGSASYDGIDQVTAFLSGLPEGTVIYHHWLGWEYGFYLFGAPLYLAYWPDPAWLARDVQAFGQADARYIVFPAWESSARAEAALAEAGYRLRLAFQARAAGAVRFRVYRVVAATPSGVS
ncbi:MAG: glycosyltransferase 87 family protein, partial [Anaerolineae bacterium]